MEHSENAKSCNATGILVPEHQQTACTCGYSPTGVVNGDCAEEASGNKRAGDWGSEEVRGKIRIVFVALG